MAAKAESCNTCHSGAGEDHQAIYDKYVDDSNLALTFTAANITSAPTANPAGGGFDISVQFTVTNVDDGEGVDRSTLDQLRFYAVRYDVALGGYYDSCSLGVYSDVDAANGVYAVRNDALQELPNATRPTICAFDPTATDAQVYGYAARIPLFEHETGPGSEIIYSHVHLYDDVANTAVGFGAGVKGADGSYESPANVAGCIKCHGNPYLKHGYRAAVVEGIPDFAACKSCHYDDRSGGHEDWQWMVDEPYEWATTELGVEQETKYAYTANIMNDVHMSHGMEFPYPQSMSNCVQCHEGKLDEVLADEEFKGETCKSCHPLNGTDAGGWQYDCSTRGLSEEQAAEIGPYCQAHRAPSFAYLWEEAGVSNIHSSLEGDCTVCHAEGGFAPAFSELHTGYDTRIFDADGVRYADTYTLSIDDITADLEANTMTVTFSASDPTAVTPEILVSFYGWGTRQFILPSHTYDAGRDLGVEGGRVRFEWEPGDESRLFPSVSGTGTAGDPWVLTVDLAAWVPGVAGDEHSDGQPNMSVPDLIEEGIVTKVGVTLLGTVDAVSGSGLKAVTETFDLGEGGLVANYFQGDTALVDEDKCNDCHMQLPVRIHGNGASTVPACRNCHNPTYTGGHLEMASRSIDNYVHTIHSFQNFDTDDDFEEYDPVYAARYDQHIKHVFPNFTITNCEACHVSGTVTYNVPDQSKALPGVLSETYVLNTWYGIYPQNDPSGLEGKPFEDASGRDIGFVPEYVTGPASRACGGCHRARLINQDEAGALASWNAHTQTNGTYVPNDPEDDDVLFGVINKIMSMF